MKTQKSILAIALVLMMTFSFFSCGKPEATTETTTAVTQTTAETTVAETEKPEKPITPEEMTAEELLRYSKDKFANFTSYESVQKMEVVCKAEDEDASMTITMDSTDTMPVYGGNDPEKYNADSTLEQKYVLTVQGNTVEILVKEYVLIVDGILYDRVVTDDRVEKEQFKIGEELMGSVRDIRPIYLVDAFENYTKTKTESGYTLTSETTVENSPLLENFISLHKDVINKLSQTNFEKPQGAKAELYFDLDGKYTGYLLTYQMYEYVPGEEAALFTASESGTIVFDIDTEPYSAPEDAEQYIPEGQPKPKTYWVTDFADMAMVTEVHKTAFGVSMYTEALKEEETAKVFEIVKNLKFHFTETAPHVHVGDPVFYDTLYLTEENAFYYYIDGDMGYLSDPLSEADKAYMMGLYDTYLKNHENWAVTPFADTSDWNVSFCTDYDDSYYYFSNALRLSREDAKILSSVFANADFVKTIQYALDIGVYRLHVHGDNTSNNIFYDAKTGIFYDAALHIEFRLTEEEKAKVESVLRFYLPFTERTYVETADWRLDSLHTEMMEIDGERRPVIDKKTLADNLAQEDMAALCEIFNTLQFEDVKDSEYKATLSLHMEINKDGEILQIKELCFDRTYKTVLVTDRRHNFIAELTPEQSETMRLTVGKYLK